MSPLNPILRVDNHTYEIVIHNQETSKAGALLFCSQQNNSQLTTFANQKDYDSFIDAMKEQILPDLIRQRAFWEFFTALKSDVEPENAVAYGELSATGMF